MTRLDSARRMRRTRTRRVVLEKAQNALVIVRDERDLALGDDEVRALDARRPVVSAEQDELVRILL